MLNKVYYSLYENIKELPQKGKTLVKLCLFTFLYWINDFPQDFYLELVKKQHLEDRKYYNNDKTYYTEFFKELYNYRDPFNMSKFTQDINNLNAQYYLYYYFADKDPMKLPKFFFYQLPVGNKYTNLQFDFDTAHTSQLLDQIEVV